MTWCLADIRPALPIIAAVVAASDPVSPSWEPMDGTGATIRGDLRDLTVLADEEELARAADWGCTMAGSGWREAIRPSIGTGLAAGLTRIPDGRTGLASDVGLGVFLEVTVAGTGLEQAMLTLSALHSILGSIFKSTTWPDSIFFLSC